MDKTKLISDLNIMKDEEFICWYTKTIKFTSILNEIVPNGINDEYYQIFSQVLDNNIEDGIINQVKIIEIFAPESDYFYYYIECCKKNLIKKILNNK